MKSVECMELAGGLGNQLFQFTAGLARSVHQRTSIAFDTSRIDHGVTKRSENISSFVEIFSNQQVDFIFTENKLPRIYDVATHRYNVVKRIDNLLRPSFNSTVTGFDEGIYTHHRVAVIRGYFQSWKYLDYLNSQNVNLQLVSEESQGKLSKYSKVFDFDNDIAIHVRRGDYSRFKDSIGLLSSNYYLNAINEIGVGSRVVIFSDNAEVSKEFPDSTQFCYTPELTEEKSINSLYLMSNFRNLVISNSTFSWWAAALGRSDKFVVGPNKWFRGLEAPSDISFPKWSSVESDWII